MVGLGEIKNMSIDANKKQKLIDLLNNYVVNGGDVNNLRKGDKLYHQVIDAYFCDENGRKYSLEEKFSLLGFPRRPRKTKDLEGTIRERIQTYRKNGGNFHITRGNLPFYESVRSFIRIHRRKTGELVSLENAMRYLGAREFSDIYFRLIRIGELKNYRDNDGFVDGYRQNDLFASWVASAAQSLGVPLTVFIELICNENLREKTINLDVADFLHAELVKYCENGYDLKSLYSNDHALYERVRGYARYMATMNGEEANTTEVANMLLTFNPLKDKERAKVDLCGEIEKLTALAKQHGGALKKGDIPSTVYDKIYKISCRNGVSIEKLLKSHDIVYKGGLQGNRFSKITISEFPYMEQMRAERDRIVAASGISVENGYTKEEAFENWVLTCVNVYTRFEPKIEAKMMSTDNLKTK